MATSNKIRESKTKSIHISLFKFLVYFTRKNLLFYFISTFTKHPHQFIYSTHLFNKIFIFFTIFYYFLHIPLTHCLSLPHRPTAITKQPTSTIINPSSQTSSTHPAISTHIPETPFNPKESQINPNTRNPIQPKRKPNQPHSTRNPLIKQSEIKESNQIGGEINDWW